MYHNARSSGRPLLCIGMFRLLLGLLLVRGFRPCPTDSMGGILVYPLEV